MIASPTTVVSSFAASLVLMSAVSVAILRLQARQDRLRLRIARTTAPHRRQTGLGMTTAASSVGLAEAAQGIGPFLARIFGFDPALPDHYVVRWWIGLAAALLTSALAVRLASELAGPAIWAAAPVLWILLSRNFFQWCVARRRNLLLQQFPDALAMIVRAVRVGIPVVESIRAIGRELQAPTSLEFARMAHEMAMGVVLEDALKVMAERNDLQEYRFFATALSLQNQTGGALSETLETLADVIRKRVAVRQKGQALATEAKTSAMVLTALPLLAALGLWIMNSAYISILFVDPMGQQILAAAILALTLGVGMMKVMIRKSLS